MVPKAYFLRDAVGCAAQRSVITLAWTQTTSSLADPFGTASTAGAGCSAAGKGKAVAQQGRRMRAGGAAEPRGGRGWLGAVHVQLQHAGKREGVFCVSKLHLACCTLKRHFCSHSAGSMLLVHIFPAWHAQTLCERLSMWSRGQGITLDVTLRCRPACLIRTRVRCAAWLHAYDILHSQCSKGPHWLAGQTPAQDGSACSHEERCQHQVLEVLQICFHKLGLEGLLEPFT